MNEIKEGDQAWRETVRQRYADLIIEECNERLAAFPASLNVAPLLPARKMAIETRLAMALRLRSGEISIRDIAENKQLSETEAEEIAELHLRTIAQG